MSAEKKLPKRRFKQFLNTPSWEQRKLGEVASLRGGYAFKSGKFLKKGIPVIRISNILSDGIVGGEFAHYYEEEMEENFIVKDKSILIAMSGATTGKVGILHCEENQKFYQNQRVGYFEPNDQWSYKFIGTFVKSKLFEKQLDSVLVAGAQPNISSRDINDFDIWIPNNINEQNQIGVLFESFDNLITLHQRKLNKLENLKKAYLEELFPDGNQCKPKRRFKEFKDDWEQRKLGEIATVTGGGTPSTNISEYWNGDIDWYSPVEIGESRYVNGSIRKITKLGLEKSSAKILPVGTVLFTSRAGIGNTAILQVEGCTNQGFQSITPNLNELDTYFLYTMTPKLKRYGEITGAGSTFVEVSGKQMEQMNLMVPSIEEQKRVGELFKTMDDAITLHQRKLQKLKKMKEAYLEELFV